MAKEESRTDVVAEIDKAVTERVQKTLRQLKSDCAAIEAVIQHEREADAIKRETNSRKRWNGTVLLASCALVLLLLACGLAVRSASLRTPAGASLGDGFKSAINVLAGMLTAIIFICAGGAAKVVRHQEPVLEQQQLKRLDDYASALRRVAQQAETLHDEYIASLAASRTSSFDKSI